MSVYVLGHREILNDERVFIILYMSTKVEELYEIKKKHQKTYLELMSYEQLKRLCKRINARIITKI